MYAIQCGLDFQAAYTDKLKGLLLFPPHNGLNRDYAVGQASRLSLTVEFQAWAWRFK